MRIEGTTAVVTGAASGMGRELALEMLRRGARVAAVDRRADTLEETRTLALGISSTIETFAVDVADRRQVCGLPDRVRGMVGEPDILINNAGIIQPFVVLARLELEQIERVFDVNFFGSVFMIKAFLPGLLTRPRAHILNVASVAACVPVPGQVAYGASKAAVKALSEGLRSELRDTTVGVTVACPGAVATDVAANSGVAVPEAGRTGPHIKTLPAARAARIMIDAIEAGKARVMVGNDAVFMDLLGRLSPRLAAHVVARVMRSLLS